MIDPILAPYVDLWQLAPDGKTIVTPAARLLAVRSGAVPAMLKVVTLDEAKRGSALLAWWDGQGAARVYEWDGDAILMERALGDRSLVRLTRSGRDDEATHTLCGAIAILHLPRGAPPPDLVPLDIWFEPLAPVARTHGGLLARADAAAQALLTDPRDILPLHGDIHHENVLDFGPRGWLAIDPHGVVGERGFDYANIFCNPDLGDATIAIARDRAHFFRRLDIVARHSDIERHRLLQWILAWCGLSAAWFIEDGMSAEIDLAIAALAAAELDRT
jgi:streptomycin 6-kinase